MPLVGVLLLVVAAGGGPEPSIPSARAVRVSQRPKMDGTPDPVWDGIPPVSGFTQQTPDEGARPSEATTVRIAYDDRGLYFLVRAEDRSAPAGIVANLTRRDRDTGSDAIIIDLDTRGSHTGAFHFEVSAAGVQRDALRTGDDSLNFDWDALWNATVRRDDHGWTQPFYSRRIGAAVDNPVVVDGSRLAQLPEPAGVLGAAKLTGRAGPVELALLDGLTDSETIGIAAPEGPRTRPPGAAEQLRRGARPRSLRSRRPDRLHGDQRAPRRAAEQHRDG